ncbi:hypothetical protein JDV02_001204 [Purpureocillium takamizusanense]|uniref:Mid2 domain-containing protein n=1 Tax=Purpureocillium takamizusanense TaxID=2060973 RepID=A0A9Q8Q6A1_9HYPO|nr:uncharacterized protein JDV02_001204 [Purpureocillium takamizusanense]UNI14589.1 hypothetical protein JDV02_001204 [Purpureocillium takamizusanense]
MAPPLSRTLRHVLLAMVAPAAVSAMSARPPSRIFGRDNFCASNGLQQCSADLPSEFCCPKGSSCMSLAGQTTVLCCPQDSKCEKIQPITCNIREQDPRKNPQAPIKTTLFDAPLQKCGADLCCPFGYTCATSGKECTKDADQTTRPKASQSSSAATPSATISSTPATASTANPQATRTTGDPAAPAATTTSPSQQEPSSDSGPEKTSIIGGAVGGCLVSLLIITVIFLYFRRRRQAANSEKSGFSRSNSSGSGPYGAVISAPVLHPGTYRSDFLRGSPPREFPSTPRTPPPYNNNPRAGQNPPRISIPNPFDSPDPSSARSPARSPMSATSHDDRNAKRGHVGARLAPIRAMRASVARHSRRPDSISREPSSESINVFADPTTVSSKDPRATTFSDMMDQAGLEKVHKGKPYVAGTTPRI